MLSLYARTGSSECEPNESMLRCGAVPGANSFFALACMALPLVTSVDRARQISHLGPTRRIARPGNFLTSYISLAPAKSRTFPHCAPSSYNLSSTGILFLFPLCVISLLPSLIPDHKISSSTLRSSSSSSLAQSQPQATSSWGSRRSRHPMPSFISPSEHSCKNQCRPDLAGPSTWHSASAL